MASKAAFVRLRKEYMALVKQPTDFIVAKPAENNILKWYYVITGPPATPYEGGEYLGKIVFPSDYPFKPPSISMSTPNGRFRTDFRLCLSMSDYHPASWNPSWSVETILKGLLSFMLEDEVTTGSITSSLQDKRSYAAKSHEWNCKNRQYRELFPELCTPSAKAESSSQATPTSNSNTTTPKPNSTVSAKAAANEETSSVCDKKTVSPSSDTPATSSQTPTSINKYVLSKATEKSNMSEPPSHSKNVKKSSQFLDRFYRNSLLPMGILTVIGSLIAVKVFEMFSVMTI